MLIGREGLVYEADREVAGVGDREDLDLEVAEGGTVDGMCGDRVVDALCGGYDYIGLVGPLL